MKKTIFCFFCALGFASVQLAAMAQETLRTAPLNPDFKQYLQEQKKDGEPRSNRNGYAPPPLRVHFGNYETHMQPKAAQQLPVRYDLRNKGWITPVKNQGDFGTCWAFSAIGAIESRWLRMDGEGKDLSEKNMVTCHGYAGGPDDGGNQYLAAAYLTRLQGPLTEQADPYFTLTDTSTCRSNGQPPAYIPEMRFLPNNREEVKRAIMNHGAVSTSMYANEDSRYYNPEDYTWYYNGSEASNHGILIVGWDDNKQVTGGTDSPETRGAWIIKNSWGTGFGNSGYFYLAYDDNQVLTSNAFYPNKEKTENIDSLHHYDKLGMVTSLGSGNETLYGLTRFELQESESIQRIGTFTSAYGTEIEVIIYDDFNPQTGRPVNPTDTLPARTVKYPGYHVFNIASEASGEVYVQVRYSTPGYGYPLPVETAISGYASPHIEKTGTNWFSSGGQQWVPMGSDSQGNPYDLCIRAYTRKKSPVAAFGTERRYYCIDETLTFHNHSTGEIGSYSWHFGNGAEPPEATGPGPHQVSYDAPGNKTIALKVEGPAGSDSIARREYVVVAGDLHIFFGDSLRETPLGDTLELQVNGHAQTYDWSGDGLVSSSGNTALVSLKGNQEQTTTIRATGHTGSCTDSDSIRVRFIQGPGYDDVCSAHTLEPGLNENLTNQYATVQANEPMPDTSGLFACTEAMKWCNEGGLQHTVWFRFEVPMEGQLSAITSGMDTQIAIYQAENCEDILTEDQHTLLAANDDYFGKDNDFAAAIMDLEGLTPGQTYWLQLDGSAGGVTGTFSIELTGTAVDLDNKPARQEQTLAIYPNPSGGTINMVFDQPLTRPARLEVLTPDGRKIHTRELQSIPAGETRQIHLPVKAPGIYILRVSNTTKTITRRLIIQ
jgi:C1A family cysteine protease